MHLWWKSWLIVRPPIEICRNSNGSRRSKQTKLDETSWTSHHNIAFEKYRDGLQKHHVKITNGDHLTKNSSSSRRHLGRTDYERTNTKNLRTLFASVNIKIYRVRSTATFLHVWPPLTTPSLRLKPHRKIPLISSKQVYLRITYNPPA